jgi:hypothetical protein
MNVLDNYKVELLNLGEPVEIEDDTYFCKFNYNNMPFMIKTNKVCLFKKRKKNKDNLVNISITSKDYLVWFESFYKWCIQAFHERSEDWFEEPLTFSDVEFSFINPLKSNIKDNCFDIQCTTNEDRLHIVDTNDNVNSLDLLEDCNVVPTFHIKGVTFNSKHFHLDIELNNVLIILDDLEDSGTVEDLPHSNSSRVSAQTQSQPQPQPQIQHQPQPLNLNENFNQNSTPTPTPIPFPTPSPTLVQKSPEFLNLEDLEVSIPTDDLEEMNMDIESNGFYKTYDLLDEKIKDNIIKNLKKMFIKKKIKVNVDLMDIFDEE